MYGVVYVFKQTLKAIMNIFVLAVELLRARLLPIIFIISFTCWACVMSLLYTYMLKEMYEENTPTCIKFFDDSWFSAAWNFCKLVWGCRSLWSREDLFKNSTIFYVLISLFKRLTTELTQNSDTLSHTHTHTLSHTLSLAHSLSHSLTHTHLPVKLHAQSICRQTTQLGGILGRPYGGRGICGSSGLWFEPRVKLTNYFGKYLRDFDNNNVAMQPNHRR